MHQSSDVLVLAVPAQADIRVAGQPESRLRSRVRHVRSNKLCLHTTFSQPFDTSELLRHCMTIKRRLPVTGVIFLDDNLHIMDNT